LLYSLNENWFDQPPAPTSLDSKLKTVEGSAAEADEEIPTKPEVRRSAEALSAASFLQGDFILSSYLSCGELEG